jgi:hypothetical protein
MTLFRSSVSYPSSANCQRRDTAYYNEILFLLLQIFSLIPTPSPSFPFFPHSHSSLIPFFSLIPAKAGIPPPCHREQREAIPSFPTMSSTRLGIDWESIPPFFFLRSPVKLEMRNYSPPSFPFFPHSLFFPHSRESGNPPPVIASNTKRSPYSTASRNFWKESRPCWAPSCNFRRPPASAPWQCVPARIEL